MEHQLVESVTITLSENAECLLKEQCGKAAMDAAVALIQKMMDLKL
jgi:hypothetical protein